MTDPIPAHVVTGPLGSGKTTAIAGLLARKPPEQDWVVLLNEFSEAGIDTLTVASAARGAFDVRLVPGGCLCCAGEQDFRRNLQELVTTRRPHRIIVEPSGLGHPAGIVEELLAWESRGALRLAGIVALLDPARLRDGALHGDALAQAEIADALALSKADLASADDRARFQAVAAGLFPAKTWIGEMTAGVLPPDAFEPQPGAARALRGERPPLHVAERHEHGHEAHTGAGRPGVAAAGGWRREVRRIGHTALSWEFPRAIGFCRSRLAALLAAAGGDAGPAPGRLVRVKGVFRTAEDEWLLAQADAHRVDLRPTSWRRDSRVELLFAGESECAATAWDHAWLGVQQR